MFNYEEVMIRSLMNGMVLTMLPDRYSQAGAQLAMHYPKPPLSNQKFYLIKQRNYYSIRNRYIGKSIDLQNAKQQIYSQIIGYSPHNQKNQRWLLEDQGNGIFYITSAKTGLVMQIQGGIDAEGIHLVQNRKYHNLNQLWVLEKL